jgi:hypothetical protein
LKEEQKAPVATSSDIMRELLASFENEQLIPGFHQSWIGDPVIISYDKDGPTFVHIKCIDKFVLSVVTDRMVSVALHGEGISLNYRVEDGTRAEYLEKGICEDIKEVPAVIEKIISFFSQANVSQQGVVTMTHEQERSLSEATLSREGYRAIALRVADAQLLHHQREVARIAELKKLINQDQFDFELTVKHQHDMYSTYLHLNVVAHPNEKYMSLVGDTFHVVEPTVSASEVHPGQLKSV